MVEGVEKHDLRFESLLAVLIPRSNGTASKFVLYWLCHLLLRQLEKETLSAKQ